MTPKLILLLLDDSTTMTALIDSHLPGLQLLSKGKVRDIYATSLLDHLLFIASDRISAYDVILKNVRPCCPSSPSA